MRSGSTLLRYLLNSHERLSCPPESKFISSLRDVYERPQTLVGLGTLGISEANLDAYFRAFIESIMSRYATAMGKTRWIDKTPAYYTLLPFLDRVFEQQCQYVFLVRHPMDCVHSLEQFSERFPGVLTEDADAARFTQLYGRGRLAWIHYWIDVYSTVDAFRKACPQRSHVIRYEDLVSSTAECMARILEFLGEDPSLLHLERALSETDGHGYQDDKIRRTSEVHRESVGCSREWPGEERSVLWEYARDVAGRFGYDRDSPLSIDGL